MNKLGGCKQKIYNLTFIVVMYASFYIYQILNILGEINARIVSKCKKSCYPMIEFQFFS